jgi:glycosyltransferase involved in cell wall biosynthesis
VKVLLVAANYPPELLGGTERVVSALARELVNEHGDEVVVVCGGNHPERAPAGEEVVESLHVDDAEGFEHRVLRIPRLTEEGYGIDYGRPRITAHFVEILTRERPDVVHVHHLAGLSWQVVRSTVAAGIRCVMTHHDAWAGCVRFFRLRPDRGPCPTGADRAPCIPCINTELITWPGTAAALLARRDRELRGEVAAADVLTAPSAAMARSLRAHLPTRRPVEIVPHGLLETDLVRASDAWQAPSTAERAVRIGTFGNLVPEKGVEVLVEACERLARRRAAGERSLLPFELALHGHAFDASWFEGLVARLRALDVEVATPGAYDAARSGRRDDGLRDDRHPAAGLDIAVFPSLCAESYGLVVDEALARGVPVVVSDRGALPERVGEAGLVVDVGTPEPLERALAGLLAVDGERLAALRASVPATWPTIRDAARVYRSLYRPDPTPARAAGS